VVCFEKAVQRIKNNDREAAGYVRAVDFKLVDFFDKEAKRQIILIYTLGEDGIVREFANGKWVPFPIAKEGAGAF
jgi:hypothetical protein